MIRLIPTWIVVLVLLSGCAHNTQQTLFDKLGGHDGLTNIVNELIKEIGKDKQIFHYFRDARVSRFREHLIDHFCAITDGPCQYTGDNMTDIHTGMKITEKDFNRLVDLLVNAMEQENIPHPVQNELLAILAPLRRYIIYI